jgi:hypothetical protein
VAYLRPNTFFAVGKAREPRKAANHEDAVNRTLTQHSHIYFDGVVHYTDAEGAFYEDFTDPFKVVTYNYFCGRCLQAFASWQGINLDVDFDLCEHCQKFPYDLNVMTCECGAVKVRLQRLLPHFQAHASELEVCQYPQRADVEEWVDVVPAGVVVSGLSREAGVPVNEIIRAAFEIPKEFFDKIRRKLQHG